MALTRVKKITNDSLSGSITVNKLDIGQIGGRRNIVINGAMQVAQRGTSSTGQGASSNFLVDRFRANHNGNSAGRYTVSQVADVHDGFANALKFDCTTADTSIAAAERFFIEYPFEGQDLQQFRKGSSDAKDFVVSFYAKANGNFTYVVGFYDNDNNRTVSRTFSVTSSWQRFTINFGKDTTGAFGNDNALSLQLRFYLHAGSNYTSASIQTSWNAVNNAATAGGMTSSFFSSTDNEFFLTGVQLEVGAESDGTSVATPFEHRSYAEELALCQRYLFVLADGTVGMSGVIAAGTYYNASTIYLVAQPPVQMRATPSLTTTNSSNHYIAFSNGAGDHFETLTIGQATPNSLEFFGSGAVSATSGHGTFVRLGGTSNTAKAHFDAEL